MQILFFFLVFIFFFASINGCTEDQQQFTITISTPEPLGLRLSESLAILEFLADAEGRSRAIEASGLAEIGDRLLQINNFTVSRLAEAVERIASAPLPKTLRFQTHDRRCVTSQIKEEVSAFDHVVLSLGDIATDETFYAVLSSDGKPPSCEFRQLLIADPMDACAPLNNKDDAKDKIVIVPSLMGCPAHQKAALVQEAGASALLFIQRTGEKPQRIKLPEILPVAIRLPLVMVSSDSGHQILSRLANVPPNHSYQLRFVLSEACLATKYAIHPDDDPLIEYKTTAASSGFLTMTISLDATTKPVVTSSFEFLKQTDALLPMGKWPLIVLPSLLMNGCEKLMHPADPRVVDASKQVENAFVLMETLEECLVTDQVAYFTKYKAAGVILADPAFPSTRHAIAIHSLPVVMVSVTAYRSLRKEAAMAPSNAHVLVEFSGEDALAHQWKELAVLSDATQWPSSEIHRDRLVHRMLKAQATVDDHQLTTHGIQLTRQERYEALLTSYWNAQRHYAATREN